MDMGTKLFRSALLGLAGNKAVEALALRFGLKLGANKFVAGETMEEALAQIKRLNAAGIMATLDHLGEGIRRLEEAEGYRQEIVRGLEAIGASGANANVSLKPTQLGLALDPAAAYRHIRHIAETARKRSIFVRLDMENTPYTHATINMVRRLHDEGFTNTGTVIQAYLYRSSSDIRELRKLNMNLRLVKGAYKESKDVAYPKLPDVNDSFKRLIEARLRSGCYTAIATHDESIIKWVQSFVKEQGIAGSAYEFQMLYGVRFTLQAKLAAQGYRVRCYVPYGRMWYPYFVRRLAERPANVAFILKSMFKM